MLRTLKQLLTRLGPMLSSRKLEQIQSAVNYLRVGKWMDDRQFVLTDRVRDRTAVFDEVAARIGDRKVLYLEFGVSGGSSMRYWSERLTHPGAVLHGFDSFEGLPETAGPWAKGQFGTQGVVPDIGDPRVRFFKGWFDDTLPQYAPPHHDVLVVNLDCDLYSSALCVLHALRPHIRPGTVIYFDEMSWVDHEPRAFDDFIKVSAMKFNVLAADKTLNYVAFECVGRARELN